MLLNKPLVFLHIPRTAGSTFNSILLYIACIFWTLAYDTIYAYQDRYDDIRNNIKSTAVLFGSKGHKYVQIFYNINKRKYATTFIPTFTFHKKIQSSCGIPNYAHLLRAFHIIFIYLSE